MDSTEIPSSIFQPIFHHKVSLLITSYRPDVVIYNATRNLVVLLELTCPLDSIHHLESARDRKQSKEEYLQLSSEFDRLGVPCSVMPQMVPPNCVPPDHLWQIMLPWMVPPDQVRLS